MFFKKQHSLGSYNSSGKEISTFFMNQIENSSHPETMFFSVAWDSHGTPQGIAQYQYHSKNNHIKIILILTALQNRLYSSSFDNNGWQQYRGVGTAMVEEAVQFSIIKGLAGKVELHAGGTSQEFYTKLGFGHTEGRRMLTSITASAFLAKFGGRAIYVSGRKLREMLVTNHIVKKFAEETYNTLKSNKYKFSHLFNSE